ncbi:MAG TPA: hypothetical protein VNZ94_12110 [Xanthobacteraceae bacterium]|nr:hypothetical protein [Xanthobacteraceae bacterium]
MIDHMFDSWSRRRFLREGQGLFVAAATPPALLMLADRAAGQTGDQADWRYCAKCHQMFFDGYPQKGRCAAGGGHEAIGFNFRPHFDAARARPDQWQFDWRYCNKCSVMFFDGYPNKGRCAAGGGHAAQGYMFGLAYTNESKRTPPPGQNQNAWRFCGKCSALFYDGYPNKGVCPAGGGHAAAGWTFHLPYRDLGQSAPGLGPAQNMVSQILENTFNANRDALTSELKGQLSRGDLLAKGVTLYDINLRLGNPDFKFTAPTVFNYRINANHIYFKSTQPTAAGKWADPAFEVNWDLLLNGILVPAKTPTKPRVEAVVLSVPSITAKSRNVSGGAILGVANLVVNAMQQTGRGRQIIQNALDKVLRHDVTDRVNTALARL